MSDSITFVEDSALAEKLYSEWGNFPNGQLYLSLPSNPYSAMGEPISGFAFADFCDGDAYIYQENGNILGVLLAIEDDGQGNFWYITNPELEPVETGVKILNHFFTKQFYAIWMTTTVHKEDGARLSCLSDESLDLIQDREIYGDYLEFLWNGDILERIQTLKACRKISSIFEGREIDSEGALALAKEWGKTEALRKIVDGHSKTESPLNFQTFTEGETVVGLTVLQDIGGDYYTQNFIIPFVNPSYETNDYMVKLITSSLAGYRSFESVGFNIPNNNLELISGIRASGINFDESDNTLDNTIHFSL